MSTMRRVLGTGPTSPRSTESTESTDVALRLLPVEAKQFFPALERQLGVAFPQKGRVCEHLASPPGRRPRPVLMRNV